MQELTQQVSARPPATAWESLTRIPLLCRTEFFISTSVKEKERPPWYFSFPAGERRGVRVRRWRRIVFTSVGENIWYIADNSQDDHQLVTAQSKLREIVEMKDHFSVKSVTVLPGQDFSCSFHCEKRCPSCLGILQIINFPSNFKVLRNRIGNCCSYD